MLRSSWLIPVAVVLLACGGSDPRSQTAADQRPSCDLDTQACIDRCDAGAGDSCADLGLAYTREPHRDPKRAVTAFERACHFGERASCVLLGTWYAKGENVGQDAAHAASLYDRGCELGEARGCALLGVAHAKGEGVRRDKERARFLLDRACRADYAEACENLRNLDALSAPSALPAAAPAPAPEPSPSSEP